MVNEDQFIHMIQLSFKVRRKKNTNLVRHISLKSKNEKEKMKWNENIEKIKLIWPWCRSILLEQNDYHMFTIFTYFFSQDTDIWGTKKWNNTFTTNAIYTAKSFRLTTAIWKILACIQIVERCQPLLVAKVLLDTICEDEILNLHSKQFWDTSVSL